MMWGWWSGIVWTDMTQPCPKREAGLTHHKNFDNWRCEFCGTLLREPWSPNQTTKAPDPIVAEVKRVDAAAAEMPVPVLDDTPILDHEMGEHRRIVIMSWPRKQSKMLLFLKWRAGRPDYEP